MVRGILLVSIILCLTKIGGAQKIVAYYPFCGNALDLSENNNHGTVVGAVLAGDRFNIPSRAYSFNGDNTYIFAGDNSTFNLTDSFSACGWMMPATLPPAPFSGVGFALVSKNIGAGNDNPKWIFALQNGRLAFHINGPGLGNGLWLYSNVFPLAINQWNHFGFSKAGNVVTFYLNGNPIGSSTLPNPSVNPSTPLYIGYSEPGFGMRGKIDEVRLYDYTLSAAEMKNKFSIDDEFVLRVDSSVNICALQTIALPSGKLVNNPGTYKDTLKFQNGCDSIIFTFTVADQKLISITTDTLFCAGGFYRLPSGTIVSTPGLYRDTLRTSAGCDSLITTVNLLVQAFTAQALNVAICAGQFYTLPSLRTVSAAGNYADTLRYASGCDSIRYTINLSVSPTPFGNMSATLCAGQTYTLPSGRLVTQAGSYIDTIRTSVTGCDSVVAVTLTYRPPITVSLSGPASVCAGVSATLTATASGGTGGPYTYLWFGAAGSGNTIAVNPTATTKYVVTVSDGCTVVSARDSITITIIPPPQPGLNNATRVICRGSNTQLTAAGGATYAWSPAIGLSDASVANPVAAPLTDTQYKVIVTTAQGCVGEDSIFIRVNQPYTLTASLDTFVCAGGSVQLTASGAQRYEWAGAGISATSGTNVIARPATTATYTVTGYGPDNCFLQTRNIRVTVIPLPAVDAGRDTTIMVGTGFVLQPTYTGSNLQYRWTPPQYLSCTNCPAPTATPAEQMEYTINVRNAFGCEATGKVRIQLLCNTESVFLPNTFTPNGDGINDIWYPRGGGIRQVKYLKVFNRWGQLIFERTNISTDDRGAGWDGTYKGQPLASDVFVYTMAVTCNNGQAVETKGNVMIVR